MITKICGLAMVIAAVSGPANAGVDGFLEFNHVNREGYIHHQEYFEHNDRDHRGGVTQTLPAPEIDPASAMSALTMLASGLVIMRGRRIKK